MASPIFCVLCGHNQAFTTLKTIENLMGRILGAFRKKCVPKEVLSCHMKITLFIVLIYLQHISYNMQHIHILYVNVN